MNTFLSILLWLWQLPQNLIGVAFRLVLKNRTGVVVKTRGERYYIVSGFPGGISLGNTIIVNLGFLEAEKTWDHEYGHALQSRYLGPLYLIIIGLPSLLWAWYWTPERGVSYYSFFTEKWADKLGNVKRQ